MKKKVSSPQKGSNRTDPAEARDPQGADLPEGLAQPARRALLGAELLRLEQIATYSENQLKRLHGIGPNAIEQLRHAMAAKGLSFAGDASSSGDAP